MPTLSVNGIALHYDEYGAASDPLVVLVMGTGAKGNVWSLHQVPALVTAGYRVITYDSRGMSPVPGQTDTYCPDISVSELVDDLAVLIEHFGAPAHVIGTSLGARVVQELALARPDLVRRVVAMAGHTRIDDVGELLTRGEQELFDQSVELPKTYKAAVDALLNLSPATLRDEEKTRDWLAVLEYSADPMPSGERGQLGASDRLGDRTDVYRTITGPLLVMSFADDLVIPAYLGRELADVVPSAQYVEVPDAGHFGYLEQPELVNRLLLDFLAEPDQQQPVS
ncbi:alpha/beta fold hydrolase [Microbacterium sp. JB110]|uniref:alpha/beta fold hydrolase n=1 Tax=Microbacterium sp. JB110 TaxID=2024477 RepID=UPI00097EA9C0|nr:alpha/beta fold hydrolase [Microbacterium sp. JB110]RCS61185.1 alpha/beta fold hydrolase [Microbacterium sp. JB110]SJM69472.1 Alpha/beta hydrolase fold [Frigoribacterium sp. JB110]